MPTPDPIPGQEPNKPDPLAWVPITSPGRPKAEISAAEFFEVGTYFLSWDDMARYFGVSRSTIADRMRDPELRRSYEEGMECAKVGLRKRQYTKAMQGDTALLIFLGKVHLNQREVNVTEIHNIGEQERAQRAVEAMSKMDPTRFKTIAKSLLLDNDGNVLED